MVNPQVNDTSAAARGANPTTGCIHFEGHSLSLLEVDGRPAWIVSEVGEALGYTDGRYLVDAITGRWSDELVDGADYCLLRGEDLQVAKRGVPADCRKDAGASGSPAYPIDRKAGRLLVLFETGLHLVLLKTTKPAGKRLRRFLAERVLPDLARGRSLGGPAQMTLGGAVDAVRFALADLPAAILHSARVEELLELVKAEAEMGHELPHFRHHLGEERPDGLTRDKVQVLEIQAKWRSFAATRPDDPKRGR